MKIRQLSVAGLRGFDQATFDFDPQFTLLVGVNGVGKSSVLEALRVSLSRVMPKFTASRATPLAFSEDDIRSGAASLTVDVLFRFPDDAEQRFLLHKPTKSFVEGKEGSVREGIIDTPEREEFTPLRLSKPYPPGSQPIAAYFGTRRSHPSDEQIRGGRARSGPASAYADALSDVRPLHLRELASWMLAQEALAEELPRAGSHLEALRSAAARFLPTCTGLRATNGADKPRLKISKDGVELDVRSLSEGERGMLALALDLARRLSQANPGLDDPVKDGFGMVLIDEIDMHMHPLWQRQIVPLLRETFSNCQFIATSHSPFVVQSMDPGELINLDRDDFVEYSDKSIEDISENVMGVDLPQKSKRYLEMMRAAEEYFTLVRQPSPDRKLLASAESRLNELSVPFSDDPAFQALLKLERQAKGREGGDASS